MVPWTRTDQTRPFKQSFKFPLAFLFNFYFFKVFFSWANLLHWWSDVHQSVKATAGVGNIQFQKICVFAFAELCLYLIIFCTFCIYSVSSSVKLIRRGNQDQVLRSDFQQWWFNLSQSQLTWLGCFVQKDIFPIYNSGGDESFISSESQRKCFCQIIINIYFSSIFYFGVNQKFSKP